jgi:hypothetical protein
MKKIKKECIEINKSDIIKILQEDNDLIIDRFFQWLIDDKSWLTEIVAEPISKRISLKDLNKETIVKEISNEIIKSEDYRQMAENVVYEVSKSLKKHLISKMDMGFKK